MVIVFSNNMFRKKIISQFSFHPFLVMMWSNYSGLTRVFTPNGGWVREMGPLISGKFLGWWNMISCGQSWWFMSTTRHWRQLLTGDQNSLVHQRRWFQVPKVLVPSLGPPHTDSHIRKLTGRPINMMYLGKGSLCMYQLERFDDFLVSFLDVFGGCTVVADLFVRING